MAAALLEHLRTSVRRFLAWWSGELSDAAAGASRSRAWRVMFLRGEKGCDVYLRTRDGIEPVGTGGTGDDRTLAELRRRLGGHTVASEQTVLRLQPSEVVLARLSVPAGASDVLEPIVRNQIERLAPWPADKALFAYESTLPPNGAGTLDVPVVIAARALVDGLVAELENLGFPPGRVDYGANAAAEPRLNLLAAGAGAGRRSGRLMLATLGFLWLAALAAGAVGSVGVVQQTGELAVLGGRLDELRAATAAHLPGQAGQRRRAWLAAERAAQPSMAVVLEAVSRALPDSAWLTRLEVEQGVVRLAGNAANAAAIIGQIEASGHFADVQFAAPTTLGDEDGRESFTITARILPGRTLN